MSLEEQIAQTANPTLFTRLCNSLLSAVHGHAYQVIDGTRGDEGNDGWLESESRVFAIYCPLKPERRTDADYRKKAFDDLEKALLLRESGKYSVKRWTFVTPRPLSNEVIVAIRKRGDEFGIEANHVEATYLSGLMHRHPELLTEFPDYHVSQLEELVKAALNTPEARKPSAPEPNTADASSIDIFNWVAVKEAAARDERLKDVVALRESADRTAAKRGLRALVYSSTDPIVQINATAGLFDHFDPMQDNVSDLVSMCEAARGAARRVNSKAAEAYLVAQRGFYQSFEFGSLAVERWGNMMMEQSIGLSLEDSRVVAQRQKRLEKLSKGYTEAFKSALELAHESKSGAAMAAVLICMGNAAGQRATTLAHIGPKAGFENERDVCKRAHLAAKEIYAQLGDEHQVANAQFNLANQIRFLGEIEEAQTLVTAVIPVAEKYGDEDLLRKARLLEERLRTGEIPDHIGQRRG